MESKIKIMLFIADGVTLIVNINYSKAVKVKMLCSFRLNCNQQRIAIHFVGYPS